MKNLESSPKYQTTFLFGEHALASSLKIRSGFKDELHEQVLQHYLNFDDSKLKQRKSFFHYIKLATISSFAIFFGLFSAATFDYFGNFHFQKINAEVTYSEGQLMFKDETGKWIEIEEDYDLDQGDSVKIIGNGRAIININDGSAIRLASNSAVTISKLSKENIKITNDAGEIYARVTKSDRKFEVAVDAYSIESLGTAFRTINNEDKKGVEVYQSRVKVNGLENSQSIVVEEGNQYFIINKGIPDIENQVLAVSTEELVEDDFMQWNKARDEESTTYSASLGVLEDLPAKSIELATEQTPGGIKLSWNVNNTNDLTGFKIVKSENEDPNFDTDEVKIFEDPNLRSMLWDVTDGKEYHFKICTVNNNQCSIQSNNTVAIAPEVVIAVEEPVTAVIETPEQSDLLIGGNSVGNGILINWEAINLDLSQGINIIFSSQDPVLDIAVDNVQFITDSENKSFLFNKNDGKDYHFKVCRKTAEGCDYYSDTLTIKAPFTTTIPDPSVKSIVVNKNDGGKVSWTVDGESSKGYIIMWSKLPGPIYPLVDVIQSRSTYIEDPKVMVSEKLEAFASKGQYYVRICEYKQENVCGVYSNEIKMEL